jgi:hypothetical protein
MEINLGGRLGIFRGKLKQVGKQPALAESRMTCLHALRRDGTSLAIQLPHQ